MALSRIVEIAKRSNQYVQNLSGNIVRVVESNKDFILDLNRSQMLNSKDALDKPLIHAKTKSANLSRAYARRTGKTKPDLFLHGNFQKEMVLDFDEKEYFIGSFDEKTVFLTENYGSIFGVSPKNQPKAQTKNTKAVIEDYKKQVFK